MKPGILSPVLSHLKKKDITNTKMDNDLEIVLAELLAVMHGDGGHHQANVGTVQAVKDAFEMLHNKWVTTEHLKDINSVMQQNHNLKKPLESFVRWYWKEIDGKPYDISAEELVREYSKSSSDLLK